MAFLSTMNIVASGLTAEQLRMDVISENITNQNTTRTVEGGAYRRKVVVFESETGKNRFRDVMAAAALRAQGISNRGYETAGGVRVAEIAEDPSELPLIYDPDHPDANEEGYLEMPNITMVKEITDAMAASQAFNANITAFNILKEVVSNGLNIGG